VLKARELHLAGATVLKSPMGFGRNSHLHTAKILQLSTDLPMVIEIVDASEKIQAFLPVLDEMMDGGSLLSRRCRLSTIVLTPGAKSSPLGEFFTNSTGRAGVRHPPPAGSRRFAI